MNVRHERVQVFVVLSGVSGNLGDAVIRRRVLEWVRDLGEVHAFLGNTTTGWKEQLGLAPGEHAYGLSQTGKWLRRLMFDRGRHVLVFAPGEVGLELRRIPAELTYFAATIATRARGGVVFRPPRGVGDRHALTLAIHRLSAKLSNFTSWRERNSLDLVGRGKLLPDTAFGEPATSTVGSGDRDRLLISLRGHRPFPSSEWFAAMRDFASDNGLSIVLMSQVDEDETRTAELAAAFAPTMVEYRRWGTHSDLEQERAIRLEYERCAIAVSDRLHVLILASKGGAIPVEAIDAPAPKVRDHFETIGYANLSIDTSDKSSEEIRRFLELQLLRGDELAFKLERAEALLYEEVSALRRQVTHSR